MPDSRTKNGAGTAGANDLHTVIYSLGGEDLGKCRRQETTWSKLRNLLATPERTREPHARYRGLSPGEKAKMKARPGFITSATFKSIRRKKNELVEHGLVALDLDAATRETFAMLTEAEGRHPFRDYEYALYTTRSHTPEEPRLRIVMAPTRTMSTDEWAAVTRLLAQAVDPEMEAVDHVSFRATQLMYLPSASADQEFFPYHNPGKLVDPDEVLAAHPNWRDFTTLPQGARERSARPTATKAENPTEKRGIVGHWCRTYNVEEAIEKFLPHIYVPGDCHETGKPRYTYLPGSAANGVVVEDGGLFIYSHHGTDPCGERLCNVWDMCQIQLFGHLDNPVHDPNLPITSMPSYKAMVEFAEGEDGCRRQIIASELELINEYFEAIEDEETDADLGDGAGAKAAPDRTPGERKRANPPEGWEKQLQVNKNGLINSPENIRVIIQYDRRLHDRLVFDELRNRVALRFRVTNTDTPLLTVPNPPPGKFQRVFDDVDSRNIKAILEYQKPGYGFTRVNPADVDAACTLIAHQNPVHEVRDYCEAAEPEWDGVDRLSTMFARHLGEAQNAYTGAAARLYMLGIVARAYEPGHKFDFMPIIQGEQGIRKSGYPGALFGRQWVGNLTHGFEDVNKMIEQGEGKVVLEVGELHGMKKSSIERMKEVIAITHDKTRLAYGRSAVEYPRRFLLLGTTNDMTYLTDPTGNRRFWPLTVPQGWRFDLPAIAAERRQIFGQATREYKAMRAAMPDLDDLPLFLPEGSEEYSLWQKRIGKVMIDDPAQMLADEALAWVAKPIPLSQFHDHHAIASDGEPLVIRVKTCAKEMAERALGLDLRQTGDRSTFHLIRGRIAAMPGWETKPARIRGYGPQTRGFVLRDATVDELHRGYRIVGTYRVEGADSDPLDDLL